MSFDPFTTSSQENGGNGLFTFGEKMRVLRKLHELEFSALDRGAAPEEAVLIVYQRALDFYDSVWPEDEGGFRETICKMQEKRLRKVLREKKSRIQNLAERHRDVLDLLAEND